MIQTPKDFFQQIQNLCEEVALKIKAVSGSLSSFLTKTDAEDTYLSKTDAANTYLGKDEKVASAVSSDFAATADNAINDASGNEITKTYLTASSAASTFLKQNDANSMYLGKSAKAASAYSADSATTAVTAGSATKAIQDGDGHVISGTYLKNTDAESTYLSKASASSTYLTKSEASSAYLGKTAKAASASTADSATKATQDGSGNNIANTYATIASLTTTNTNVTNAQTAAAEAKTSADAKVALSGSRGTLAGYNTPVSSSSAVTINASSNDDTIVTAAVGVTISNGTSGQTWTKTVALQNASATVSLGTSWKWVGGSAPTITANSILVLKWCGTFGIANLVSGS